MSNPAGKLILDSGAINRGKECLLTVQNVLIAEDHPLFREALADVAGLLATGVESVAVEDCAAMLTAIENDDSFDLLLLDYFLPGSNGFGALMDVRAKAPGMPVVIVSSLNDAEIIRQAAALGVAGFLPKTATRDAMVAALRVVLAGGTSFPDGLMATSGKGSKLEDDEGEPLTPRQMEVLQLMAQGKSNKEIARVLGISQETVKVHISAILRRLGCSSRTQAVMAARNFLG